MARLERLSALRTLTARNWSEAPGAMHDDDSDEFHPTNSDLDPEDRDEYKERESTVTVDSEYDDIIPVMPHTISEDRDGYKECEATVTVGSEYDDIIPVMPHAIGYTTEALYEQIHNGDISLELEYQRSTVWPESKQIAVIDSLFRNFYIPLPIFVIRLLKGGLETKTCVDGRQRLRSIYRFMNGLIPYKSSITGEELWYTNASSDDRKPSRARKLLSGKRRQMFANKQIICIEYRGITDSDERDIFQRAQLGMVMTSAERLQAINTPRAMFIRRLQRPFLTEDNKDTPESEQADFQWLALAVYCIEKYGPGLGSAWTVPLLEGWLSQPEVLGVGLVDKVESTFKILAGLVQDKRVNGIFGKPAGVAPIEFVAISILIAVLKDRMSTGQLAAAIGGMRVVVRDAHANIRNDRRVVKTMLDYIRDVEVAEVEAVGEKKQEKRKREDEDDDESAMRKPKMAPPPSHSSKPLRRVGLPLPSRTAPKPNPAPAPKSTSTPCAPT
ncbi:hypothetical protein BD779DRAFT_1679003 [Infundibulicybe gibba]|nr:hypothetical protein BD779DRAFT_1679003 [Infundibulicybe gibba]